MPENSFWDLFESEIGIPDNHERNYIYGQFSGTFSRQKIKLIWSPGNRRQFVETIREEIKQAATFKSAKRQQALEFFAWYFNLRNQLEVNKAILLQYSQESRKQFPVADAAIPSLKHECQVVSTILRWGDESDTLFTHISWGELCKRVLKELGTEYDLRAIRLLIDEETLLRLLNLLQNRRTPSQFLIEVERSANNTVTLTDGRIIKGHRFLTDFNQQNLLLGIYRLGSTEYHIVPQSWLRFDEINQWPWSEIVVLRSGWLGYRKKSRFDVIQNGKTLAVSQCVYDGTRFFIWVGTSNSGVPLKVDGQLADQTEGVTWHPTLIVKEDKKGGAQLTIQITKLQIYQPQKSNAIFTIATSQGVEKRDRLDSEGRRQLFRDVTLPLIHFKTPVEVSLTLDDWSSSKRFVPASAYLFSTQTLEAVSPRNTKHHDGRFFWLFLNSGTPEYNEEVIGLEATNDFEPYSVFRVSWKDASRPFKLKLGDVEWKIEQQRYLDLWTEPQSQVSPRPGEIAFSLTSHQYLDINLPVWQLSTNIPLRSDNTGEVLKCQWIRDEKILLEEFAANAVLLNNGVARLTETFIERLRATCPKEVSHAIRFTLRFYWAIHNNNTTLAESHITILPTVIATIPRLAAANEFLRIHVASQYAILWDSDDQIWSKSHEMRVPLQTQNEPISVRGDDLRINCVTSKVIETTFRIKGHEDEEFVSMLSRPFVWSVSLWERPLDQNDQPYGSMYQSPNLNFYGLPSSLLVFSARPHALISLKKMGTTLWQGHANEHGVLVFQDLTILQNHCDSYVTQVEASSGSRTFTISVIKAPRVISLKSVSDGNRVELIFAGPADAKVITTFMYDHQVHSSHSFSCQNKVERAELDVPRVGNRAICNVQVMLELPNSSNIPAATLQLDPNTEAPNYSGRKNWLIRGVAVSAPDIVSTLFSDDSSKR